MAEKFNVTLARWEPISTGPAYWMIPSAAYNYWWLNGHSCSEDCSSDCQCFWMCHITRKIARSHGRSWPHLIMVPWAHASQPPNCISVGSAIFTGLRNVRWPTSANLCTKTGHTTPTPYDTTFFVVWHHTRKVVWRVCGVGVVCPVFVQRLALVGHHTNVTNT